MSTDNRMNGTDGDKSSMMGSTALQQEEGSTAGIKKGYVFSNVLVISLGFMQFGYGISSWSNC